MRNASGHQREKERQWKKTVNKNAYDSSSIKRVTRKFRVVVVQKQRQRNIQKKCAARVKFLFLLIITTVVFPPASNADFLKGSSRVPALLTEPVRMCFACQHFDVNSAGWISDNLLHVISSWYLRTMGKEFIFRFSRRSWGRNAWRTPKNVCSGGYFSTVLLSFAA